LSLPPFVARSLRRFFFHLFFSLPQPALALVDEPLATRRGLPEYWQRRNEDSFGEMTMSTNLPSRSLPTVEWLEARIAAWNTNYASIGVTSAQVLDLATGIANARTAYTSVTKIRADSKSTTLDFNGQATVIHDKAAGMIANIKAFAEASGNAATVYALANVSPADAPTPAGPPVTPSNVRATVQNGGNVLVEWDGSLAQRTFFEVLRIVDSAVEFSRIASIGEKEFVDTTVPQGSVKVQYAIRAVRGTSISPNAGPAVVQIGSTPIDETGTLPVAA
jgi:hypothetical protein